MNGPRRARTAPSAAAIVAVVLGACGSDSDPAAVRATATGTATASSRASTTASAMPPSTTASAPAIVLPASTSAKTAHAEIAVKKVSTPATISDDVPGVRKATTSPPVGSRFVLVEATVRSLDCVVDVGGPPPAASASAPPPKIAEVTSQRAVLVGPDGRHFAATGGGETADSVCGGCDASYNPPCVGERAPVESVTIFFLFAVPNEVDLASTAFEYADARAKLPPVAR